MNSINTTTRPKRVLLGISGGVAAYKAPDLVRRLADHGAQVRVVMTDAACEFITPLALQAVSGRFVHRHLLDSDAESGMDHIELARWAQIIVIAPATANFMAKIAGGVADDLLSTLVLATEAEIFVAPAMNKKMWNNPATQTNLQALMSRNIGIIGPDSGGQACGDVGLGRMTEPNKIVEMVLGQGVPQQLAGKKVLITAGPTWEAIDPVRGITNRSSGKMGFALAEAAKDMGAIVTLISGPVELTSPEAVDRIDVISAQQMHQQVMDKVNDADLFAAVAAVADYRPVFPSAQKIKKSQNTLTMQLKKNPDILYEVGRLPNKPWVVGFAAETENLIENARIKFTKKAADMIVANHIAKEPSVFGCDNNEVVLISRQGEQRIPPADKYDIARTILKNVHALMMEK